MLAIPGVIDFNAWLEENRHLLKPPVGNKLLWQDQDFYCMAVGGPNQRTDYHYDEGPEYFYQLEGEMVLKLMTEQGPKDVPLRAGQMFLLPPKVPHSPQRMADSVGLVIERRRTPAERDGLMWYCQVCNHKLYEEYFMLENIETQFPVVFEHFFTSIEHRTCAQCGALHPDC